MFHISLIDVWNKEAAIILLVVLDLAVQVRPCIMINGAWSVWVQHDNRRVNLVFHICLFYWLHSTVNEYWTYGEFALLSLNVIFTFSYSSRWWWWWTIAQTIIMTPITVTNTHRCLWYVLLYCHIKILFYKYI